MSMPRGAAVVYPGRRPDRHHGRCLPGRGRGGGRRRVRCPVDESAGRGRGGAGPLLRTTCRLRRHRYGERAAFFGLDHPPWSVTIGDLVEELPRSSNRGPWTVSCSTCSPHGVPRRRRRRARPGGVRSSAASPRPRNRPRSPRRCVTRAPSPSPAPGSHWCVGGISKVWPCGPSTACTDTPASLITTRRLAPGVTPPLRKRRPVVAMTSRSTRWRPGHPKRWGAHPVREACSARAEDGDGWSGHHDSDRIVTVVILPTA